MSDIKNEPYVKKGDLVQLRLNDKYAELLDEYYFEVTGHTEKLPTPDFVKAIIDRAIGNAREIKELKQKHKKELTEVQAQLQAANQRNAEIQEEKEVLEENLENSHGKENASEEVIKKITAELHEAREQNQSLQQQLESVTVEHSKPASANQLHIELHPAVISDLRLYAKNKTFTSSFNKIRSKAIVPLQQPDSPENISHTAANMLTALMLGYKMKNYVTSPSELQIKANKDA